MPDATSPEPATARPGVPAGAAWLFCPADRPDRFAKAAAAADVVILDLEDGVAPAHKSAARQAILDRVGDLDPGRIVVRVNQVGTPAHGEDLALLFAASLRRVMLAKAESRSDLDGLRGYDVIALCETARGVLGASELAAAPHCAGLMWGAEDLVADLGGFSSRGADGRYRPVALHARNHVLLAATAAGVPAIDAVHVEVADSEGLRLESEDAAGSGFAAKACIHPAQVPVVRRAFTPSGHQLAWARRVLAATARPGARGVVAVDGRMVDEPILRQARRVLAAVDTAPDG